MEKKYSWKLNEIIFTAMLCVVFGVIYLGAVWLIAPLSAVFTPMGFANLGTEIIFGVWFMAATLAGYIIRRPGAALIAEILAALIEVLLGNMYGPMVIVTGFVQGIGAELVFAAGKYQKYDAKTVYLASFACCVLSFVWSFIRSGYGKFSIGLIVVYFIVRAISSLLFAGVISKAMGDGLAKTGLMKGYAIGRTDD
ncbi:MAG: ECF transporter S component [Clostridia bacterium]|nr:ECF transporter S component [Clostridia bacterium]